MDIQLDFYSSLKIFLFAFACWFLQPYYIKVDSYLYSHPLVFLICLTIVCFFALRKHMPNQ